MFSKSERNAKTSSMGLSIGMVFSNSSTSSSFCEDEFNETFLKCVEKLAARGPNIMLNTANAPSKPTTTPTTKPTRRATTARLFSFNTNLPDTLVNYAPECVEGEFSEVELPLYGVLRSSHPAHCITPVQSLQPSQPSITLVSISLGTSV